jgi:drug/metabolite transporter (DMT)-like permease
MINPLLLILIGVVLNAAAQLLLKVGMGRIGHFELSTANVWPVGLQIATSLPIIGGIVCYVMSVLVWLVVLSRMEVSQAYPMMSLGYIITALAAYFWLGEALGPMRVAGIAVIMVGVYMVSKTA